MAFVRLDKNLPQDPSYPADLRMLGYLLNGKGQFVRIGAEQEFFTYYHTDNERANEARKEAMHQSVRVAVDIELLSLGVQRLYCRHDTYREYARTYESYEEPAIPILVTNIDNLRTKRDVIVIVGEHTQDLGIWNYRATLDEGGVNAGTAVGLLKKLRQWPTQKAAHDARAAAVDLNDAMTKMKLGAKDEHINDKNVPGIIILNCGQLLWSNKEKKAMTLTTFTNQHKDSAVDDHVHVNPYYNRVKGHQNPKAHVESVFEYVIPKITDSEARFYFIGISDGAEALLEYLGEYHYKSGIKAPTLKGHIEAFALMQPSHNAAGLDCINLEDELRRRGKSWIVDPNPKGTVIATPDLGILDEKMREEFENKPPVVITRRRHGSRSSTSSPITVPGTTGRATKEDAIAEELSGYERPRFLSDASSYAIPRTSPIAESFDAVEANMSSDDHSSMSGIDLSNMSGIDLASMGSTRPRTTSMSSTRPRTTSISSARLRNSSISSARPRHLSISSNCSRHSSISSTIPPGLGDSLPSLEPPSGVASPVSLHGYEPKPDGKPKMLTSWDDVKGEEKEKTTNGSAVSCVTVSSGVDLVENIFPQVMDDVLDYFQRIAARADEWGKRARLMALEGESSEEELSLK